MKLLHLRNKAIDYQLWDKIIDESEGHLPYAQSWFLDIVSPGWEAIVSDNYAYVMPLPVKRKFKIGYLVQPLYTQQLGIFSKHLITPEITSAFLEKIPYKSYQFNLNENNNLQAAIPLPNLVLDLNKNYTEIYNKFSKNTQRNIEKALKNDIRIEEIDSNEELLQFHADCENIQPVKPNKIINDIIKKGREQKKIRIFGVRNNKGNLIAGTCFLETKSRLVYLHPVSNEEGKNTSAMFALIDFIARKFSNSNLLLDFEGSRIAGVARFYRGFGAINKPYFMVKKYRPDFLTGKF